MNGYRGHVTYLKDFIKEICEVHELPVPAEYNLPVPPPVDPNFFAHPESERAQRIMGHPVWRYFSQETPQDPPDLFLKELSDKGLLQPILDGLDD